uniref:Uncharacterized protein n=1 Tax=Roseihalotalea indica TaxID=2867963 RepID=A0AA49GRM7_9BACT|nr:hypothetical protein K4G66_08010 [Tunicatimonas sp. TK19036]
MAAISITFLLRFFEFWAVLLLGLVTLTDQKDNTLMRLLPSVLLLRLKVVNVLSAIILDSLQRFMLWQEYIL